jgi:uncharacterized protein YciI
MKIPAAVRLAWLLVCAPLLVAQDHPAPAPTPPPTAAPQLPPNMTVYYFCLLTRGPNSGKGTKEELAAGQAAHMANIQRLADAGKLLIAGPFMDRGDWRGIFIFKCASLEEAKELVASDPLVQDHRLIADVRPWLTMKGNIRDPEFPAAPAAQTP